MFGLICGVLRANSRGKGVFFWQECALACNLVVVLSCCFFLKVCEEVRLSRIFLRGGWFDVGVDESQQKED
jgi:hypothetical protein